MSLVPHSIERDVLIEAPIERVWTVVTDAAHLGRWFADAGASVELRPGGRLTLTWRECGTLLGRVERVEMPHVFSFRWRNVADDQEVTATNSTLVEFTLSPVDAGTRLRVVESGFRDLDGSDESRHTYAEGNTEGWRAELAELCTYVLQPTA